MRPLSVVCLARSLRCHVDSRLRGREAGAVATIVAVLFGFGVVLGCAALTIDTGSLMWERRQLQNGADAVSLAAAQLCATTTPCTPNTSSGSALANLVDANAADGFSAIDSICGSGAAVAANPALRPLNDPACTGGPQLTQCPAVPAGTPPNFVEVHTSTLTPSGSTVLPPAVSQALTGYTDKTVKTCARAAWGQPSSMAVSLPITFSSCEWKQAIGYNPPTSLGTFATPPVGALPGGYGGVAQPAWPAAFSTSPVAGQEIRIMLADPSNPQICPNWNGHDTAGGFGYLTATSCSTKIYANKWAKIDTGSGFVSLGCDVAQYWKNIVYLPVFDCVVHANSLPTYGPDTAPNGCYDTQGGGNHWYHIEGFAKFYLSGYKLSGSPALTRATPTTGLPPCTGSQRCLSGWFLQGLVPAGDFDPSSPPGPNLGPILVQLAG